MRIAIFSDTHDNLPNFKKAVEWVGKNSIKIIIHCGDISKPEILKEAIKDYGGKVHFVLGNMDNKEFFREKIEKTIFHNNVGLIEKENINHSTLLKAGHSIDFRVNDKRSRSIKIAFCHFPSLARKLAPGGKYDLVFYGHTHQPWEGKIGKCRVVNPGNLAGLFYPATFAVYDFQKNELELKILSNNRPPA